MKRIKLSAVIGSVFVMTFFLCVSFASCNNETEAADVPERFSSDLNKLSDSLCQLINTKNLFTRGVVDSISCINTKEFDAQFQQFVSQYDLTSDLTPAERTAVTLSENEWLELMANEDNFLSYIAENKTVEFQQLFEELLSGSINDITVNGIIQNSNLKLNEKLLLTMQLDIAQNTPIDLGPTDYQISVCDKKYAKAIRSCQIQFATAIAGALGASVASGGLGLLAGGAAVISYFNCIDDANNAYEDCLKDHVG